MTRFLKKYQWCFSHVTVLVKVLGCIIASSVLAVETEDLTKSQLDAVAAKIAMVSEVPVDSYDPAKCDQSIELAWRQMLASLVGEKNLKNEAQLQEALSHPRFYVAHFGFLTRARKPSRPMQLRAIDSELIAGEAEADLYLMIRWNVPAVRALTAKWLTAEQESSSDTSSKLAEASSNSSDDKIYHSMLLWLNNRSSDGAYHVLQNHLETEDIVLLDMLRKGAKKVHLELLLPLVDAADQEQLEHVDWTSKRSVSAILQLSRHYNADFILTGSIKKRLLGGWQGDWMLWDGKKWQTFQATGTDRAQTLLAMWDWIAMHPRLQHSLSSDSETPPKLEPLMVRLKIAKIKNFEDSRKVMAYLRNLSPLIHNLELATLKSDSIELDLNFDGTQAQLESLLQGEHGVILKTTQKGQAMQHHSHLSKDPTREGTEDIDLVLEASWLEP